MKNYSMKYRDADDTMFVGALERDGKYVLVIKKKRWRLVATRHSRKAHAEPYWSDFEKEFDSAKQANAYFIGIRKKNPTLKTVY